MWQAVDHGYLLERFPFVGDGKPRIFKEVAGHWIELQRYFFLSVLPSKLIYMAGSFDLACDFEYNVEDRIYLPHYRALNKAEEGFVERLRRTDVK